MKRRAGPTKGASKKKKKKTLVEDLRSAVKAKERAEKKLESCSKLVADTRFAIFQEFAAPLGHVAATEKWFSHLLQMSREYHCDKRRYLRPEEEGSPRRQDCDSCMPRIMADIAAFITIRELATVVYQYAAPFPPTPYRAWTHSCDRISIHPKRMFFLSVVYDRICHA
jgi:hypothetical protein